MPDRARAHELFLKGVEAIGRNNIAGAAELFRRAADHDPGNLDALFNLGKACKDLGRLTEAAESFRKIVAIEPADAEAWYMLGNSSLALERYDDAERCYRAMLELNGEDVRAHTNLGVTLQCAGDPGGALGVLTAALQKFPQHPDLHYNRALALLLRGDYAGGWEELEWRFQTTDGANPMPHMDLDRWNGEPAAGKTIIILAEQGIGDTLQFARYIPEARARCGRIVLECQKELVTIIRSCPGVDAVLERGRSHGRIGDAWVPLMSLPFLLGCPAPECGAPVPYLHSEAGRKSRWDECFTQSRMRARVGLVWAGNPRHKNDHHRSCPPELLTPMVRGSEVQWTSLQKLPGTGIPAAWKGIVTDLGSDLEDFGDTAAVIEHLDLVITVDTAVAHLAGAMGKPVWLLLPFAPDWRWMLARTDSPWYPSMRIFRQPRPGDWGSVVEAVTQSLQHLRQQYVRSLSAPGDTAEYLEYANALREAGLREHAVRIYRMVAQLDPGNVAAWNNLGITLQDGGALDPAVEAFTKALKADSGNAAVMNNLGFALLEKGEASSAEEWFRRGIAQDAGLPDLHNNLGNALRERHMPEAAMDAYRQAIRLRSDFAQPHWNLAQVLLQTGEFAEGWREYEWRWRRPDFTSPRRNFSQPQWMGEDIAGQTLLVHAEQGYGDALQFVRYIPMVLARGPRVLLECHHGLVRLFAGIPGLAGVFPHASPLPDFDLHIPMMSLPGVFNTTLDAVPASVPYLHADSEAENNWRSLLGGRSRSLRVGFTWSGMQHLKALRNRACPLESLMPLFTVPGAEFFSLQKSITSLESAALERLEGVQDLSGLLNDFADTAAAVRCLDVVVSVDTAVAHLAGALGSATWVLLPFDADWRWLQSRDDSPWYPTMRLFRQHAPGAWDEVVRRLCDSLSAHISIYQSSRP